MNTHSNPDIRIGTMAGKGPRTAEYIQKILPLGFESFQINFWRRLETDLPKLAEEMDDILAGSGAVISSLGIYGNPLGTEAEDEEVREGWRQCIEMAPRFGCDLVCGFAGRVRNVPIDQSLPRYSEVFEPLARRAQDLGVRLAFENCRPGVTSPVGAATWNWGDYNIAYNPRAWDMIFNALPFENIGLEWEPCHQLCQLIDPMPQLRKYVSRIFHVHGKDAKVHRDILERDGIAGPEPFAYHKHPGLGDSDWIRIIDELRKGGFRGSIDIEGWHDDVYRGELEMTGQVHALNHLRACRLDFVPNPEGF